MAAWFEIKVRGMLGPDDGDMKDAVLVGRIVRYTDEGIEFEAHSRHRQMVIEYVGLENGKKGLSVNGDKETKEEDWEHELVDREEAKAFRGIAARLNFLSLDSPDLQFPIKPCSQAMANPTRGAWKSVKKIARYLVGRKRVVWKFPWQEEFGFAYVTSDSDWGWL